VRLAQHGPIECEAEAAPSPLAQLQAAREAAHMEATAAILSGKDPGNEEPAAGGSGSVAHSEGSEEAARWTEASAAAAAPSAALADVSLGDGQQEAASAAAPAGSASEARTADDGHHGGAAAAEDAQQAPPAELMLIEKGAGERLRLALLAAAELTDKVKTDDNCILVRRYCRSLESSAACRGNTGHAVERPRAVVCLSCRGLRLWSFSESRGFSQNPARTQIN